LQIHEAVHLAEGDGTGRNVTDQRSKLAQVVTIIFPGARLRIAAAYPVDELLDLG